jgi:hypothetical protein
MVQESQDDLTNMISEQGLHIPHEFSTGFSFRKCAHRFSQRQTQTPQLWTGMYMDFLRTNTGFSFLYRKYIRVSGKLASTATPQDRRIEWMRTPLTDYFICFICMHQG